MSKPSKPTSLAEPTVAQIWGEGTTFVDRARQAVPDRLMADIVADNCRQHYPAPPPSAPAPEPPPLPTYVEWCQRRGLGKRSYEDARRLYLTALTQGRDVGEVAECPQWIGQGWVDTGRGVAKPQPQRGTGWVDPPKVADWQPPGLRIMDQMLDQQDALDRRDLERRLGKR